MVEQDDIRLARRKIIYARLWWLLFHGGDYFWLLYSGTWSAYFYHESAQFDVVSCTFMTLVAIMNFLLYIKLQCSCPGFVPQSTDNEHTAIESYDTDVLLLEKAIDEAVYDVESGRELHYCDICHIRQPLRSKHCKDCGRCIQHYDHHCVCAGVCVGRDNHRIFICYTAMQSIEAICAMDIAVYGFTVQDSIGEWFAVNFPYIIIYFCCFFTVLIALPLTCYHVYLVLTNQTSWEHARRSQITYLQDLQTDRSPFDQGYAKNCWQFIIQGERNRWTVPLPDQAQSNQTENTATSEEHND